MMMLTLGKNNMFLRHDSNNEEFWKIRSRIHISYRLSSKYIFWLNFLGIDFLFIDTSFLDSVCGMELWKDAFNSASAQLPCTPKEAELSQCALEKHQQDRRLWKFLRDRSSLLVMKWAYASCPKQFSHKGRSWQICTLSCIQSLQNTVFLAKAQASSLPSICLRRSSLAMLHENCYVFR